MKAKKVLLGKKTFLKTVSSILSLVMTVNIGLNLLTGDVFAEAKNSSLSVNNDQIRISSYTEEELDEDNLNVYLESINGKTVVTRKQGNADFGKQLSDSTLYDISINDNELFICMDYDNCRSITLKGATDAMAMIGAGITVNEGYTLKVTDTITLDGYSSISNSGTLIAENKIIFDSHDTIMNYGTLKSLNSIETTNTLYAYCDFNNFGTLEQTGVFDLSKFSTDRLSVFYNYSTGKIIADVVLLNSVSYSDEEGSEIHVTGSFTNNCGDLNATVFAEEDTIIYNECGGTFTLQVGDAKKTVSGVIQKKASEIMDDSNVSLDRVPDIYVGEDFDYSNYVHTASGYPGEVYFEYSYNASDWSTDTPTADGQYYIRAVAPAAGSYLSSTSATYLINFKYLDEDEIDADGKLFSYGNVKEVDEQKYVDEKVKVVPKDGYKIYYNLMDDDGFVDYLMLSYDDIFDDYGNYRYQVFFKYKIDEGQEHAGAETKDVYINSDSPLNFQDIIFDTDVPTFEANIADPETGEYILETSVDGTDVEITADILGVTIYDQTLVSVTYKIGETTYDVTDTIIEGYCDLTFNGKAGEAQAITITATDVLGKKSVADFTLYHEPVDPTLTVTLPEDIYVDDDWEPEVETNSDGKVTLQYKDLSNDQLLSSVPREAGIYEVTVSVESTNLYNAAQSKSSFEIVKRDLDATVSVANTYVGGTVTPEMTDLPDDYNGTITYEYKYATEDEDAYSDTVPTAAGTYSVRATLTETNKYTSYSCENTFKIFRNNLNASVSVEDVTYGETVSPVLLHIPDDYDGDLNDVIYEYKLSSALDSAYSDTVPTAVGTYSLRVTIPETAKYEGAECIAAFKINKAAVTASVTVADFVVGNTPAPVVTSISDGKKDATFEYKLSTADDSAYDDTVPTTAGTYSVRATIPETDSYLGTTCESTFTISRNAVTATMTVADIYIGGTISPVVTTASTGEITYEYKLSDAPDTEYSGTPPTATGTYTVRATIAATAYYASTTCTAEFSILKKQATATVSVADIYVGQTPSPVVTSISDGKKDATFEYKLSTEDESAYDGTVPTAAGTYDVRATIPETNTYLSTTCESSFTISKNPVTATMTVADIYIGGTISPVVTTVSTGDITYEYKLSDASDSDYSGTPPTAAGTYTVRATIAATNTYDSTTCTAEFSILKKQATATVSVADIYVGSTPAPVVTTDSDGKKDTTFEYKLSTEDESAYDGTVPTAAGTYDVRATIPETNNYLGTTCESSFTISKNPVTATMTVADIYIGGTISPVVTTLSTGDITYEYKLSTATSYSTTVPTAAGTYTVRATIAATDTYESTTCTATFKIMKLTAEASVSVANIYVGSTPAPVVTTDSDGKKDTSYEYKLITADESAYDGTVPTAAGTYNVRATIPETNNYLGTTCESSFTISKNPVTATMTVEDIYVGGTIKPVVTTVSTGNITYEYKLSSATNYSTTIPTAAGTYTVRATIAATAYYESTACTAEFSILKKQATATVSVANITVGSTPAPVVTTDSDGKKDATFEYKLSTADDSKYSGTVPTAAGTYNVRATVPETNTYLSTTCESSFTISKNPVTATMTVEDIYIGGTIRPVVTTVSTGNITYEYKLSSATNYSTTPPTAAGTYTVRATIAATDIYESTTCTATFKIMKLTAEASVSVADIKVGQTPSPVVTTVSDGKKDTTFEYKLSTAANYSTTVPTAAGTYNVRATIPETNTYLSTTCESTFTISKNPVTATMTVADIYVGGTIRPVVTTASTGEITYEYKLSSAANYSKTVPTAAGTYTVRATIAATAYYESTTCTAEFSILKKQATATVSVADIYVGSTPEPVVSTVSNGKKDATFEYKLSTADDSKYSGTVPTAAGTYNVRATVPETNTYLSTTCTTTFKILKKEATASVSVANITVGGKVNPVVTTNSDGKKDATFEYKLSSATKYSKTVPTAAGVYTVRATIPETDTYLGTTCTAEFTISKKVVNASVSVANIFVGGKLTPVVTTVSDGKKDATFEYKLSTADDSKYSGTVPTAAGTYNIRATIPATVEYAGITCTSEFIISLNPVRVKDLKVPDIYVGQTVKPEFKTDSNGEVTIMYKSFDAEDKYYTKDVPTAPGKYTARATVSETGFYEKASCTTDFTISYLDAPADAYNPDGKSGNNGYFTSDVELKAPKGYKISTSLGGEYKNSIPYTDGLTQIYLKRDDGALTAAIDLTQKPKIDKTAPVLTTSSGDIDSGSSIYTSNFIITVNDKNLELLTVNGEEVKLDALDGNVLKLSPGYGIEIFEIVAEDAAGNKTVFKVILLAEWLRTRTIIPDVVLPLSVEQSYNLDSGEWTVTKTDNNGNTTEDKTVYSGDMPVYVNESSGYTFTKVSK